MPQQTIQSFKEFWPYYLGEHRLPKNRLLHYIGSFLSLSLLIYSIASQSWWLLIVCFLIGYGFAWIGHFFVEKNKPATFQYPLWSFIADYKMFAMAISGKLKHEWPKYF
ncbi:DUF962 domain-containing protein [Kangiella sp. TOML190]|uniref:DUF962 domain-containing protein n=1 Tax=Kangiella sp. TOML190 TaxID=2931351 RepID=UPI00203CBE5E|nr:DUF962 domain-containing protein [Kangiella sp. TOML190]